MIETLKAQLHLALRRQFGPRHEFIDVDQLGLFAGDADASTVIELGVTDAQIVEDVTVDRQRAVTEPAARKRAVRILKDLPRDIKVLDIPEGEKTCGCCNRLLRCIGVESSEHPILANQKPALRPAPSTLPLKARANKTRGSHCLEFIPSMVYRNQRHPQRSSIMS